MFTTTALRAPILRAGFRVAPTTARSANLVSKRYAQQDNRGGKSKLVSLTPTLLEVRGLMIDLPNWSQGYVPFLSFAETWEDSVREVEADWIDVPVELYPMGFVVGAGVIGAAFAIGRHFYLDGVSRTWTFS